MLIIGMMTVMVIIIMTIMMEVIIMIIIEIIITGIILKQCINYAPLIKPLNKCSSNLTL